MTHPRLAELLEHGQSPWLDQVRRAWLSDGTLAAWIEKGVCGVTSNPTIFASAIRGGDEYARQIHELGAAGMDAASIYDVVTLADIRAACALFESVYLASQGADGFVSHEVPPSLAYDTEGTVREAQRLWTAIGAPNAMIKIPATREGLPAIRQCLEEGININVTLMFTIGQYDAVAEAFLAALEARASRGQAVDHVASVASFFVSRVDTVVDAELRGRASPLSDLEGKAAVANATQAYRRMLEWSGSARWARLSARGGRVQRVLWASTSTKDPAYDDLKYVTELVAADTVNTLPLQTLEAVLDHGRVADVLDGAAVQADRIVADLAAAGIDLEAVGQDLLIDGVRKFADSFDEAVEAVSRHLETMPA